MNAFLAAAAGMQYRDNMPAAAYYSAINYLNRFLPLVSFRVFSLSAGEKAKPSPERRRQLLICTPLGREAVKRNGHKRI